MEKRPVISVLRRHPAAPVVTKDTIELQRRGIICLTPILGLLCTNNRSGGTKRPLARAPDSPARSSIGRAPVDCNLVNIICLMREDYFSRRGDNQVLLLCSGQQAPSGPQRTGARTFQTTLSSAASVNFSASTLCLPSMKMRKLTSLTQKRVTMLRSSSQMRLKKACRKLSMTEKLTHLGCICQVLICEMTIMHTH